MIDERRAELVSRVEQELNLSEVERVHDYIDSLQRHVDVWREQGSWLATKNWTEEFTSRLQAHHAINVAPLTKTTFEDAFAGACDSGGRSVVISDSTTNRFWDIKLDGEGISLKTTAAKNLHRDFVHISKLTEAAWIQDQRGAASRRAKTIELVQEFRSHVSRILMLRVFKTKTGAVKEYELVEIPGTLLDPIVDTPRDAFNADGPSIPVPYGSDAPGLIVKLDRSDAKITLSKIRLSSCVVHARWSFPETAAESNALRIGL